MLLFLYLGRDRKTESIVQAGKNHAFSIPDRSKPDKKRKKSIETRKIFSGKTPQKPVKP